MPVLTDSEVLEEKECDSAEFADQTICHAGLRIGYAVGARDIIEKLRKVRMPWSVNSIAIEAAHYLIGHAGDYAVDCNGLHAEALRVSAALKWVL